MEKEKNELLDLKSKRKELNKEIDSKEWSYYKNKWRTLTLIQKFVLIIGIIGVVMILFQIGLAIGRFIG